jgi:hypothetical protein
MSNKPRLINHPNLPEVIKELKEMNISTYDLFQVIMALDEGRTILSMLLDEYPNHEDLN